MHIYGVVWDCLNDPECVYSVTLVKFLVIVQNESYFVYFFEDVL